MSRGHIRDALVVVALAAALAGLVAVLVTGLRDDEPPVVPETPAGQAVPQRSAERFLDSIGVNVHVTYLDTSYARIEEWQPRLRSLGIRHVRDGLEPENPSSAERLRRLAAVGLRLTLITSLQRAPDEQVEYAQRTFGNAVEALEAPNELDVAGPDDWEERLQRFLPALRRTLQREDSEAPDLIGPSFVDPAAFGEVRDVADAWDVDNLHPYPGGNEPASNVEEQLAIARRLGWARPVQATETGYHNALEATSGQPPVSEDAAADYVPRLALGYFAAGIQRAFLYELADQKPDPAKRQPEQHFGLLREDLTPKPAFEALRNLLQTIRATRRDGRRHPVRVKAPEDVRALVLRREDGGSVLALWRDVSVWDVSGRAPLDIGAVTADVFFLGRAQDVEVSRPSRGGRVVERREEATSVRVPVAGDAVLVSFR